jgi:methyl-accepting chemotaxis protein
VRIAAQPACDNQAVPSGRQLSPSDDLLEQIRAEIELTRISYEHQLHVTRHVIERNDDAFRELTGAFHEFTGAFHEFTASFPTLVEEIRAGFHDLGAKIDAQTEAIFRLIDRFDNGGAGPSAA